MFVRFENYWIEKVPLPAVQPVINCWRKRRLTAGYASIIHVNHRDDYIENENWGQHNNTCYALPLRQHFK